jgi:cytochrome c2
MYSGRLVSAIFSLAVVVGSVQAQEGDLAAGEQLYLKECSVCHGNVTAKTSRPDAVPSELEFVRFAMSESAGATMRDFPAAIGVAATEKSAPAGQPGGHTMLAVAPPYGPHLRGIIGREAGTIEGFRYSNAFMKALKGMKWDEPALDVWMTSPQKWVPGVYMFYSQKDAEIRRKILLYLKERS